VIHQKRQLILLACILSPLAQGYAQQTDNGSRYFAQDAIVSTNTGSNPINGLSINEVVGATTFYQNGYTGSRAIVGVVEGGHIWNGHETLQHVDTFVDALATYSQHNVDPRQLGEIGRHATWVGHTVAGRTPGNNEYQKGIAYGASLWSGAMATDYFGEPYTGNWGWSRGYAFTAPYSQMTLTGVDGRRADVINSSWGFSSVDDPELRGGNHLFTVTLDGMAKQSRAVFVAIAGNEGNSPERSLRAPGNGYNGITVGALSNDLSSPPYNQIGSFSSRGAQDYNGPDGFVPNIRAIVDIVAPGDNLSLAFYGGTTGGNSGGIDPSNGANDWYSFNMGGTSFAAPIVSGGATLLVDVARDRFASNIENAKDGQVIKAVLLNAAAKPGDWNNGQSLVSGVMTTTQALDYTYGAGKLDLNQAFDQYTTGTTDIPGPMPNGASVKEIGWDFGEIVQDGVNEYFFEESLLAGTEFTATLNWFVDRTWEQTLDGGGVISTDNSFTNLSLELWLLDEDGVIDELVALSDAEYINTEHFSFTLEESGEYALAVRWMGERYDFVDNDFQTYGLAWSATAVPEPTGVILITSCLAGFLLFGRRRR